MTNEYFTEAVVLDREPIGESDIQVTLYTKNLGKVTAKAVGARKAVSRLAAHLEPLHFVQARLVEKNRFQVVDALKTDSLPKEPGMVAILQLVKELAAENQSDFALWELLRGKQFSGEDVLGVLGFDGSFAVCENCGRSAPDYFLLNEMRYACGACLVRAGRPANFALK